MDNKVRFTWIKSYEEIASTLLKKRNQESYLLSLAKSFCNMGDCTRIDPFTFMAMFNRGLKDENRTAIIEAVIRDFGLNVPTPQDYVGIPLANNKRWRYMDGVNENIDVKWDFFASVLDYADMDTAEAKQLFEERFNRVLAQKNIGLANLTMALFWCRPKVFLPLDSNTTAYLIDAYDIKLTKVVSGSSYIELLEQVKNKTSLQFPEISAKAYEYDGWWPPAELYHSGLNETAWETLVLDKNIFTPASLDMLSKMLALGGSATCKELAEVYGDSFTHYNVTGFSLGKRIMKEISILPSKKDDGGNRFWCIPFLGKTAKKEQPGDYIWKIRPELERALETSGVLETGLAVVNHWIITPGEGAWAWDEFQEKGIAAIGWDYLGDFANYDSKSDIADAINKRMPELVEAVRKLNRKIATDPSLDEGFCIGHSYFCCDDEGCVDSIVKYELIPLIKEYWFDDRNRVAEEIRTLEAVLV